ncbi:MAG: DUF429 domain-containing protein [Pseudomonadota bacterium]
MTRVLGVDGCPNGWAVVKIPDGDPAQAQAFFAPTFAPLLGQADAIAVDIPIGLPDVIRGPGRVAEQAVRPLLGPRRSSVFSVPSRAAVYAKSYKAACILAHVTSDPPRKISQQAFNIFPKMREVDAVLTPQNEAHVFEVHAEMAFWRLNGNRPMDTAKIVRGVPRRAALASRIDLCRAHDLPAALFDTPPKGLPLTDVVDAAAMALIALRCMEGTAKPFPDPPGRDGKGLRIAIWA